MSTSTRINNYNEGALAGRYARLDLSNTGKFANTIHAIPERFRFETDGTMLRLKVGSTVTIMDGYTEDGLENPHILNQVFAKVYELDVKHTIKTGNFNKAPENYTYVFYNFTNDRLELHAKGLVKYNTADDVVTGIRANTLTISYDSKVEQLSLPLGVFDKNWSFKAFNAISFYDYYFFTDAGIEFEVASGRDSGRRQVADHVILQYPTVTEILIRTGNTYVGGGIYLNRDGSIECHKVSEDIINAEQNHTGFAYSIEDNHIYRSDKTLFDGAKLGAIDLVNGRIADVHELNVFQSASEIEIIHFRENVANGLLTMAQTFEDIVVDFETNKPKLKDDGSWDWS